jgi:thioredoxin reductase (NADPH)
VGLYYGATNMEAPLCEREEVSVVGGGNSAGQAAVYLTQFATHVHVAVRSDKLSDTMSALSHSADRNPSQDYDPLLDGDHWTGR